MVFISGMVVRVARASATVSQYIACNPQRLSSDQVLDLIFRLPLQQIRWLGFCLWDFFCCPFVADDYYSFSFSSSSSSSSSSPTNSGFDLFRSASGGRL